MAKPVACGAVGGIIGLAVGVVASYFWWTGQATTLRLTKDLDLNEAARREQVTPHALGVLKKGSRIQYVGKMGRSCWISITTVIGYDEFLDVTREPTAASQVDPVVKNPPEPPAVSRQ